MTVSFLRTEPTKSVEDAVFDFAQNFDHTNLDPRSRGCDIKKLCEEARDYRFKAVCVAPRWVSAAATTLRDLSTDSVLVCTVVGFPHGNTTSAAKVFETRQAIAAGAREIDMVMSIGDLKEGNEDAVERDISAVVMAAHAEHAIVKVILETAYLSRDEIVSACRLAVAAGADFVKTSTGFAKTEEGVPSGAVVEVVRMMRNTVGPNVGVKAAGGIKTLDNARAMLQAGASRLGCSSSVAIMDAFRGELAGS